MTHKILLVDDNRMYANWMRSLFELQQFEVTFVESSTEGIVILKNDPSLYDAVVSDITMEHPGAGLTMSCKMRTLGYGGLIVLVSTGFDMKLVYLLAKWTLRWIGVDGIVRKKGLRNLGEWKINWLTNRNESSDFVSKFTHLQKIPNWTNPNFK